jgi:hypothetical protein
MTGVGDAAKDPGPDAPGLLFPADTPVMAGLSGRLAVVDVVAAAAKLRPPVTSSGQAQRLEVTADAPTEIAAQDTWQCPLSHENHGDFRFCATCGIPKGVLMASGSSMERPRPAAELTPAERAERERQHAEAVAASAQFERAQAQFLPTEGEAILIHFVEDGLTAFGQVWMRGQEIEIGPGHPRWAEALTWITLTRFEQVERWGKQKFDFGPWPGRRSYTEAAGSFEQLSATDNQGNKVAYAGPSAAELAAADEAERRRNRAVPAPTLV